MLAHLLQHASLTDWWAPQVQHLLLVGCSTLCCVRCACMMCCAVLQVKAAMVDSAQQAVSQLKAELTDLQQEADETRRAADDSMAAANRASDAAVRETEALR